jgi:hypothetical protein
MRKRMLFGFFLVIIGFVMFVGTTPIITGNVVLEDVPGLGVVRILGIVFFVGGVMLMAQSVLEVRRRRVRSNLDDLLDTNIPQDDRPLIIFDMGGFMGNKARLGDIVSQNKFENYGLNNIIVPSEVHNRIKNSGNSIYRNIANKTDSITNSPKIPIQYSVAAQYILEHSGKNKIKNEIIPIIDDWMEKSRVRAIHELKINNPNKSEKMFAKLLKKEYGMLFDRELSNSEINDMVSELQGRNIETKSYLDKEKDNIESSRDYEILTKEYKNKRFAHLDRNDRKKALPPTIGEMKDFLVKDMDSDAEDISVIGTALYELAKGPRDKKILIYGRDMDIAESIESLRGDISYVQDAIEKDVKEGRIKPGQATILNRINKRLRRLEYRQAPN